MAALAERIAETKALVERSKTDLLRTFEFVPEDKLEWAPSPTARSPLWLVGHCGAAGGAFASLLRGEVPDFPADPAELMVAIRNGGKDIHTREAAVRSVEESTAAILASLDTVTEERMSGMSQTPFGPLPFAMWVDAAWSHPYGHARQLDYMETIWGDVQDHR